MAGLSPAASRLSRISGVRPIASRTFSYFMRRARLTYQNGFYNRGPMARVLILILLLAAPGFQERDKITITTLDRSFEAKRLEIKESGGALTLTATDTSGAVTTIPGPDVVEIGFD